MEQQTKSNDTKTINTRQRIIVEEVRQVELELPENTDLSDIKQIILDAYNNGKITANSKAIYLNYDIINGQWNTIWLEPNNDDLVVIRPEDPEVIPVRVNISPCRDEEELTNQDYADDVYKRMQSCDGLQHEELMNWEPIDYSFIVDDFALEDAYAR